MAAPIAFENVNYRDYPVRMTAHYHSKSRTGTLQRVVCES